MNVVAGDQSTLRPARERFFRGPNWWCERSGVLLEIALSAEARQLLEWQLEPQAMEHMLQALRRAVPAGPLPGVDAPPLVALMLAIAQALAQEFCVMPQACRLLAVDQEQLKVFVPCDERETGLAAWSLALQVLPALDALQGADPAEAIERLCVAFSTAQQIAAEAALPADMLAIVRAAAARGIPHTRISDSREFVQLGQGCRARRIRDTATDLESGVAHMISRGPLVTTALLQSHGLPARIGGEVAEGAEHQFLVIGGRCIAVSRGAMDVTDSAHHDNLRLAERAARVIGLAVAAVHVRTPDIARSWRESPCAITSVQASPPFGSHLRSVRDAAGALVSHMFPAGESTRVPTAGVTGSVGKTTTCRLVAAVLADLGKTVALATTQGAWVGGQLVRIGDVAGGGTASRLLLDPTVQAGVFELARGGLIRRGTTLDAIDVGAVLNVFDQHVGFDGVDTREQLAEVKRLVVEIARNAVVLNADDALCMAMRPHVNAPVQCLVSMTHANPEVIAHLAAGGLAAWQEEGVLKLQRGATPIGSIRADELPITFGGRFRPSLWHALFAIAICHAMGVEFDAVAQSLRRFESTAQTNPGRMNFYRKLPYELLVCHASGPEGMEELTHLVADMQPDGEKVLLFCLAGNRTDDYARRVGRVAAGAFDRYICSDWTTLRGRQPREIAQLLAEGLVEAGVSAGRIKVADSLEHGVQLAYGSVRPGDLLVENTFTDESKPGWLKARGLKSETA